MNTASNDKNRNTDSGENRSVNNDPKQGKSDPQITELDGLQKGGVPPVVNPADRPRDEKGKKE